MAGMVYLMKSETYTTRTKFGYRSKMSVQDVRNEIDNEYGNEYRCFAVYNLDTNNQRDTEYLVKQIRYIIAAAAGALETTQPEYYNISPDKAFSILKAISSLRGDNDNLSEF